MTDNEINRAIQYVTARTSYGYDTIAVILRTGFTELAAIATTSSRSFERAAIFEYVCRWTITTTGQPEPLVREVLDCGGRWLDEIYATIVSENPRT